MRGRRYFTLSALAVSLIGSQALVGSGRIQTTPSDPERILRDRFQFSPADVSKARGGQPVARMIAAGGRDELAVVGAVRLDGDKKRLADWVKNIEHFRHAAELGLTRGIASPPAVLAFADLALDAKDLAALQACRPGGCDLRVPDEVIPKFQKVAWGTPDAPAQASALVAGMLVEYAQAYLHGGDRAIGNNFGDLLRGATTFYELAPEFAGYLERFPASSLAGVDSRLYWTNLTADPGSIVSLHHLVAYRRPSGDLIIADKTIYASRYFDVAALVLSMQDTPDGKSYYLIAGSRIRTSKLSGVTGRVLRGQVERSAADTVRMYLEWLRDSLAAR